MIIIFVFSGELIRSKLFDQLREVPPHNDLGKVNLAIQSDFKYSIWGSSTAYMNVNSGIIEDVTKVPTYNFGISGAAFDQLLHLQSFSDRNTNKTIIWIVNPYEFEGFDYKLDEEQLFFHWQNQEPIHSAFKQKNILEGIALKYFGWFGISKLNSKHWNYIFNPNVNLEKNTKGHIGRNIEFRTLNNFYPTNLCKPKDKRIQKFKAIAKKISEKNKLIIILPPVINPISFSEFKIKIELPQYKVIDFNEEITLKDSILYQDNVHLNIKGASLFTEEIINQLKL
jgi:hypothetical protein